MPTVVSFTKRLPPAAAGSASRGTLAELMAQQKAAAEAKSSSMQMETPTIAQGFGKLAQTLSSGLQERWRGQELAAGQKALGGIVGGVDPLQGATPEQIAQAGEYDPEVMKSLLADRVQRQRTLADAEHWSPATPEEKAALGAAPDDPIMRNDKNGEFKSLRVGGNTTITTGDKVQGEFEKNIGKQYSEIFKGDIIQGKSATVRAGQMEYLKKLLPDSYTGPEALISNFLQNKYGINLGEKADKTAAFTALVKNMIPKERVEGSGSTSNFDAQTFEQALPTLLKSPQANTLIMGYISALANRDAQVAQIAQRVALMPQNDAIKTYQEEINKLGDPLAGMDKVLEDIQKQYPDAAVKTGGGGDTGAPATGADGGEVIVNPEPDKGKARGGVKSKHRNADGTVTFTFHDGSQSDPMKLE